MCYGVVASGLVRSATYFEVRGERGDLHAGIPACDYEDFAIEIRESVRMEGHVQNEYLSE